MPVRIVVVDDHTILREGVCALLKKKPEFEVVAEASDGQNAIDIARRLVPDIVIMDIVMPKMNGIEAMKKILDRTPEVKIIVLSMHSDKRFVTRALRAGANGYMLKDCAFDEVIQAVSTVIAGQIYLSPSIATNVLQDYVDQLTAKDIAEPALTDREREILLHIVEGKSTKEIAAIYDVSIKTIETHRNRVMSKLNINTIPGLTKYAISEGLISLDN